MNLTLQHKLQIPNSNELEARNCLWQRPLWFNLSSTSVFMYLKEVLIFFKYGSNFVIKIKETKIFIEV